MTELLPDYEKWRARLLSMLAWIVIIIFLLEVGISFQLYYVGQIDDWPTYIRGAIIVPTICNFGALLLECLIMRADFKNKKAQNLSLIIALVFVLSVIAHTHYVFGVTINLFLLAIMVTIVFLDDGILLIATLLSVIDLISVVIHRWMVGVEIDNLIPEASISLAVLIVGAMLARSVIAMQKAQTEKLFQATHEAVEAKKKADRANDTKTKFLANMSHEIRTPINAVMGMNEMILRRSKDSVIRDYAMDVKTASFTLLSLINNLLDINKIESGKMELIPQEYSVENMINQILILLEERAKASNLRILTDIAPDIPRVLYGDDTKLRQIITNLGTNAVKYTNEGTITIIIRGYMSNGDFVLHCAVKDTGIGIKEEDLPKLAKAFQRVDEARNRNIEGTGLGLNLSQQMLQMMGSCIEVDSEYGRGSEFFFDVVQTVIDPNPAGEFKRTVNRNEVEEYKVAFKAPEARVLVVDDNEMNRRVITELLRETEVHVETAISGFACLEYVKKNHYDVIFLDHVMPDMDGIETLRRLKDQQDNMCKRVPVIALTANALVEMREMYISEGFTDYLPKPIVPKDLERMLLHLLPGDLITERFYQDAPDSVVSYRGVLDDDLDALGDAEDIPRPEDLLIVESEAELPPVAGMDWNVARQEIASNGELRSELKEFYWSIDLKYRELERWIDRYENGNSDEMFSKIFMMDAKDFRKLGLILLAELAQKASDSAARKDKDKAVRQGRELLAELLATKAKLGTVVS